MDYTEELKKLRKELLDAPNINENAFSYKVLAYKQALEDFKNKEENSFLSELVGDPTKKYNKEENNETLRVEPRILSRALGINWHNLTNTEKLKLMRAKKNKSMDELVRIYKNIGLKNGGVTHITMRFGKLLDRDISTLEIERVQNRQTYIKEL